MQLVTVLNLKCHMLTQTWSSAAEGWFTVGPWACCCCSTISCCALSTLVAETLPLLGAWRSPEGACSLYYNEASNLYLFTLTLFICYYIFRSNFTVLHLQLDELLSPSYSWTHNSWWCHYSFLTLTTCGDLISQDNLMRHGTREHKLTLKCRYFLLVYLVFEVDRH